jgi:hypothetical protein
MPVELVADGRFFRIAESVSEEGLELLHAAPLELSDAKRLEIAFHLPGDPLPIRAHGRVLERRVGEGAEGRAELRNLLFLDLEPESRARIAAYVDDWNHRSR